MTNTSVITVYKWSDILCDYYTTRQIKPQFTNQAVLNVIKTWNYSSITELDGVDIYSQDYTVPNAIWFSRTLWWEAVNLSSLYSVWTNNHSAYVILPSETITWFMRNWTEYEIEVGNWVPSWWTNWQILGKDPLWPKRQNAPTSWIWNNTTWTTSTLNSEWVGTSAQLSNISNYTNTIYNVIE